MIQLLQPLRLLLKEFDELTPEEEDLYFLDTFCFYCGHEVDADDIDNDSHWCAAKQAVKSYYTYYKKEEKISTNQKLESENINL